MTNLLSKLFLERGPIKRIAVIGMGYVGIPAAVLFAEVRSFDYVYGIQRASSTSSYKIEMLNNGESPLKGDEPGLDDLIKKVVTSKKFECTSDYSKIEDVDAVTLAIQTPFSSQKELIPDFSGLIDGLQEVGQHLQQGTLIVLESTVTPGTTTGLVKEILERESGLIAGTDFGLAHAPERVMVGRLIRNIREHDRIVGGIDKASTERACELYQPILTSGKIIPMSATAAEVTKSAENTFRDLQIAAVNQLALYCEAMGINVYEVKTGIDSLKGEGITRAVLFPGAGVGGHCLTKDTYHLERGLKIIQGDLDFPPDIPSLYIVARKINDFMPKHMVKLTSEGLNRINKPIEGSKIAILGWAFINNSDDARNTPSEDYLNIVKSMGGDVSIHDPHVTHYPGIIIEKNLDKCIKNSDVIVIFTGHKEYHSLSPEKLKQISDQKHPVIVDGRNCINPDVFIEAGFIYKGIGRGDKNSHKIKE
jgi:UDP-N-acetyl-D-mannosaminuronic acid dehydrogenase